MSWRDEATPVKPQKSGWRDEATPVPEPEKPSQAGQAFLESAGNAATLGYLPHLQALAGKLVPDPNAKLDEELRAKGFKVENAPEDTYIQARDKNIKRQEELKEAHPWASGAGTAAGIIGGGLMTPGAAAMKGASLGAKALSAANTGMAIGAIQNPGDVEGDITFMPMERAKNAGIGGVIGLATPYAVEGAKALGRGAKWAARKIGSALTGVSEGDIATYAARTDEVNRMIRESGGNLTEAADKVRGELESSIRAKRQALGGQISRELEAAPKDQFIPIDPMLEHLQQVKGKLNPNLKSEAVAQIDEMAKRLTHEASANGEVSIQQLNEIKDFFQERAKSAYMRDGQIFQASKEAAQAAKGAGAIARKTLNPLAPEVAKANNQLAYLHSLEEKLNKNLIAPGKPDSALLAAGAGENPRNAKMLSKLGEFAEYPIVEKAQNLSAARSFTNPSLLPTDRTGKAVARMATGAGVGQFFAGPVGAVVGGAAASPMTLKLGINAVNKISQAFERIPSMGQVSPTQFQGIVGRVAQAIEGPKNYKIEDDPILQDQQLLQYFKDSPELIESVEDPRRRAMIRMAIKRLPAGK